jgi:cytidylate kinase
MKKLPLIAIDGYSSCGKSTFARLIAADLGYIYIDSGAMYRAVTLYCLENGIIRGDDLDISALHQSLDQIQVEFARNPLSGLQETWLNGRNVEEQIRGIDVSSVVSRISQIREVREKMVGMQRLIGKNGGVVMEGRDIGTVVFPGATMKIFMTASTAVRARRRYDELISKGIRVKLAEVKKNIRMRDQQDENRTESPLKKAPDALLLNNSEMTVAQQMKWFRSEWDKLVQDHEN